MVTRLVPLLVLAGCEEDLADSTRIRSLQIVSMVAEPLEVAPHEDTRLTVTIADPDQTGADVAVWMCTPIGEGRRCLEAEAATNAQPVQVGTRDAETHGARFDVVPLAVDVAEVQALIDDGGEFRGVLAFALACAPGVCPLFAELEAGTVDPAALADPDVLLAGLPMDGVSLAWKAMTITGESPRAREENPTIEPRFATPVEAAPGEAVDLQFTVDSNFTDGLLYPLTTVGGFSTPYADIDGATPTVTWVAPASGTPKEGHIYAVVDDGRGGQAVWFGPARVQ